MDNTKDYVKEFCDGDKLDVIFAMQKLFDDDVKKNRNIGDVKPEVWLQRQILAMFSEISELLSELNFKWWKNEKPLNNDAIKEEIIDILHFFTGMCLTMGMTSDEVYDIYLRKNKENFDRQYGKSTKIGYELDNK